MKKLNILFIMGAFLLAVSPVFAQRRSPSQEEMEKFRASKISFLTEALQLTPEEAQMKRNEIEMRVQNENGNLTDKQIIDLTRQMVETHKAEAEVREKYNKKFLDVLPPKKVLKLYQGEHQFLRKMLRDFRDRRREGENNQ